MSSKVELQRKLKEIGYEIGSFASKDTLSNIMRLHLLAVENKDVDVAKLNDLALRKNLTESGLVVGPVTSHTRSIYQRKLLEILTNETSEGQEDEIEIDERISSTPPPRTTRSSIARSTDINITSSPGRSYSGELHEPRIPLTRVDVDAKNAHNLSSYYPNLSTTKPTSPITSQQTITNSYSPQRSSSSKTETRNTNVSYGLRNPYDFQNDEPVIIRHEHKATPFRTTNISSGETISTNTNRYTKPSDVQSTTRNVFSSENNINEIRSRIFANEQKDIKFNNDSVSKKQPLINELENKKSRNNDKLDVAVKNNGTFLYAGITVAVALIVFVFYLWLEK
jgi:hypothetical protein